MSLGLSEEQILLLEQEDSGMESLTASKGDTPERKPMELEAYSFPEVL